MTKSRHSEIRRDETEIDRLDQENALLELDQIVAHVKSMAGISYDIDIDEVSELLDIWSAGGNEDAAKLLITFKAAVRRALPMHET
jgi:hypothetical protein